MTFNGHDLKRGDAVRVAPLTSILINYEPAGNKLITHVCARFIHVGGKLFWKTSGNGANTEAVGYRIERVKKKTA